MDYGDILRKIYESRSRKNKTYSLKAFSRDAGLKGHIGDILKGRYGISPKKAIEVARNLKMDAATSNLFILLVKAKHGRSSAEKKAAKAELKKVIDQPNNFIESSDFNILSKWYFLAVYELTKSKKFRSDVYWIAKTLSLRVSQVEEAINILVKSEYLVEKDGEWTSAKGRVATRSPIKSIDIQNYHLAYMEKASQALKSIEPDKRDFSTVCFVLDTRKLSEFRERIQNFRRELVVEFSGESVDEGEVYVLSNQLYSLEDF